MADDIILPRIYEVRLLDVDLQKEGDDRFLAEDVRVGASGVLEANRIYLDSNNKEKIFFSGKFYVEEMSQENFQMLKEHDSCDHDHSDEEDDE